MSPLVRASLERLRRTFAWSNSRESWEERVGISFLLAGPGGVWWLGGSLSVAQEMILWGMLVLAAAVLLRRGWLRLFGPMLFYDLLRIARRSRYFLFRGLYSLVLSLLLAWFYLIWAIDRPANTMSANEMAQFAESFFYTFLCVQFLVVIVLTPAYTAGAVAEEKERKTLEFILATDLRNREIVLSKLASRLANLALLVLTGLPILSFLQFLGGVDPNLVLAGFAATALTMLSLAGLSMLNSVLTKRPRDAIALTYLGAVAYLLLSGASWLLLTTNLGLSTFPSTDDWQSPITVDDFVRGFNVGNIVSVCVQLGIIIANGKNIAGSLPAMLRDYAIFHAAVALFCCGWAVLRLRAVALNQSYGKAQRVTWKTRLWGRPRVGRFPMLWKEVFAEPGLRLNTFSRIVVIVLVVASFIPVILMFAKFVDQFGRPSVQRGWSPWNELSEHMNTWVRILGMIVACLMLLAMAARAASSLSSERDRQTLDALLTSPLDSNAILFAKWVGNILSVRWAWLWLGVVYGLGILTGGLHPFALPFLLAAWAIYAAVLSGLGLWFSLVSRTTLRATIWTFLAAAGAGVGHWLLWMCCIPLFATDTLEPAFIRWVFSFQVGFTPPVALSCAFPFREENALSRSGDSWEIIPFALFGLFAWAVIAATIWGATSSRFRIVSGRAPFSRPRATATAQRRRRSQTCLPIVPSAKLVDGVVLGGSVIARETVPEESAKPPSA
jgi:ABC-type transport system involved in multi-copper enzyme maturation permease subunit